MASEYNNEVFMRIMNNDGKGGEGKPVPAECATEVTTDLDDLVTDYFNGEFFAVDDFRIGLNIEDSDRAAKKGSEKTASNQRGHSSDEEKKKKKDKSGKFANWYAVDENQIKEWKRMTKTDTKPRPFQVRMDEFSITRRYDSASPVLFQNCASSISFPSASIVKRKVVGGDMLNAFLRFDFEDLLITQISFEDAEVMKETIKFRFRKMKIQYKAQQASGKLDQKSKMVEYSYDLQLKRKPGQ
jgi:type VI protein secretion system component Hcp